MSNEHERQYYDDRICRGSCLPREQAVEMAVEWLSDRPEVESIEVDQVREPTHDDLDFDDITAGVIDRLSEAVCEMEALCTDDDGPEMSHKPQPGPEFDALRAALEAYLREHCDLTLAAWQPTGRVLVVRRDGTWEVTL